MVRKKPSEFHAGNRADIRQMFLCKHAGAIVVTRLRMSVCTKTACPIGRRPLRNLVELDPLPTQRHRRCPVIYSVSQDTPKSGETVTRRRSEAAISEEMGECITALQSRMHGARQASPLDGRDGHAVNPEANASSSSPSLSKGFSQAKRTSPHISNGCPKRRPSFLPVNWMGVGEFAYAF
jgi:hypothetical protein